MSVRNVFRSLLWIILLLVASAEALVIFGYAFLLISQGPRGVVGHFAHLAFSGRPQPTTPDESDRIFWTSTGQVLAAEVGGLVVIFGAWRFLKRSPPASPPAGHRE